MFPFVAAALLTAVTPPNIVMVVADDLGYGELGCYGGTEIPTPNIDMIAGAGVRMTQGYSTSPMCAPSRAGIMTGKYQQRFGFEFNQPRDADPMMGMPTNEVTLAERLKPYGYTTGLIGKWHLGEGEGVRPWEQGFDHFYGILGGASAYVPRTALGLRVWEDGIPTVTNEYMTDDFSDRAVSFVENNSSRPFFLCLAYNAVHKPYQAPDKYMCRFPGLTGNRQIFAAMLSAMDDGVGRLRETLQSRNLLENTVFIFISDNGGMRIDDIAHNGPLRGVKGTVLEGGIRVPYIVSWPAKLPQGIVYDNPVSTLDLVPTIVGATGNTVPGSDKLDGRNLIPYFRGTKTERPHDVLYWKIGDRIAIRDGDMKFASWNRHRDGKVIQKLYSLNDDISELHDIRFENSELKESLRKKWKLWNSNLPPAMWTIP
jgi:arylsulfatase A-like enzyme